jgi:hypothetical protein
MKEFKIRASMAHALLTNPRSKGEALSQTTKSYCEQWLKEQIYGYRKAFTSKYTTKGIVLEDKALEMYSKEKSLFLEKNTSFFEDDFFTGTPDIVEENMIYDFKNSFDCFTFPLFETEPDANYVAQLNVYMELTRKRQSNLVYCLQNTPDFLVFGNETPHDYNGIDIKYRIKEFDVKYDSDMIDKLKERVLLCRSYIQTLTK